MDRKRKIVSYSILILLTLWLGLHFVSLEQKEENLTGIRGIMIKFGEDRVTRADLSKTPTPKPTLVPVEGVLPTKTIAPTRIPTPTPSPTPIPTMVPLSYVNPLGSSPYSVTQEFGGSTSQASLVTPSGTLVYASQTGTVLQAQFDSNGTKGYFISINHADGYRTYYLHGNGTFYVTPGQSVARGQKIMEVGCSGFCTGSHLGLQLFKIGTGLVNPRDKVPF